MRGVIGKETGDNKLLIEVEDWGPVNRCKRAVDLKLWEEKKSVAGKTQEKRETMADGQKNQNANSRAEAPDIFYRWGETGQGACVFSNAEAWKT